MPKLLKLTGAVFCLLFTFCQAKAQGCSDAGFCVLGNHENESEISQSKTTPKSELDIQYTIARHNHNERFYVPQVNYRLFMKKATFFEVRIPINGAKDKSAMLSNIGIGDITATYNGNFFTEKKHSFSYATGLRISFSHSNVTDNFHQYGSYPMFLQSGLGTTDFIGVINYKISKHLSTGTGVQIPLLQYNRHQLFLPDSPIDPGFSYHTASNFRRQPDALLRLDGNIKIKKLALTGGLVAIFHLGNDYYQSYKNVAGTDLGRYDLLGSKGTTINLDINFRYPISKKIDLSLLYASPIKTRANIPDGLARSLVIIPKLTVAF